MEGGIPEARALVREGREHADVLWFPKGLRGLIYTNNRIESFNKQIKRTLKKQIQFVTEEALEKRLVSIFLHYNEGIGKRKVRCWRDIVAYYESK